MIGLPRFWYLSNPLLWTNQPFFNNKTGKLSFVDRNVSKAERVVSTSQLIQIIQNKQKNNPTQPVVISADKKVRYGK